MEVHGLQLQLILLESFGRFYVTPFFMYQEAIDKRLSYSHFLEEQREGGMESDCTNVFHLRLERILEPS
jgi:hypothetical protein